MSNNQIVRTRNNVVLQMFWRDLDERDGVTVIVLCTTQQLHAIVYWENKYKTIHNSESSNPSIDSVN